MSLFKHNVNGQWSTVIFKNNASENKKRYCETTIKLAKGNQQNSSNTLDTPRKT